MEVKKSKNKKLVERNAIVNTPFTAVKLEENNWLLTMGKYRLTNQIFRSKEEINDYLESNKWELITTVCSIVASTVTEELNKTKN